VGEVKLHYLNNNNGGIRMTHIYKVKKSFDGANAI